MQNTEIIFEYAKGDEVTVTIVQIVNAIKRANKYFLDNKIECELQFVTVTSLLIPTFSKEYREMYFDKNGKLLKCVALRHNFFENVKLTLDK